MEQNERDFADWLAVRCQRGVSSPMATTIPIGDDMGGLGVCGDQILVTSDMLLDGVHFDSAEHCPAVIGRKAAACSLSDCAAMAVRPIGAVVSLALPKAFELDDAKSLIEGVVGICDEFDCVLLGGDTTRWIHPLVVDVTMIASPYEGIEPVRRGGARSGDRVFVTGCLGGSICGHHLSFVPRVYEARRIASELGGRLHAMMDISDGLAIDLDRMMVASKTGATLDRSAILSVSTDALRKNAPNEDDVVKHVLSDGEDYELLIAADADDKAMVDLGLIPVGVVDERVGLRIRGERGNETQIEPSGWQHF